MKAVTLVRQCAAIGLAIYGSVVSAQAGSKCAQLTGDAARLACYDSVARASSASVATKWVYREAVDPVDDTKTVSIATPADSGSSVVSLVISCMPARAARTAFAPGTPAKTVLSIRWNLYVGSGEQSVAFRVGSKPAEHSLWDVSKDGTETSFAGNSVKLLRSMLDAAGQRVLAQVVPYTSPAVTVGFDLTGLADGLAPIRAACPDWK